jgi:pSer/pThr/pTyr-binding forkhead associated (FHA) protein
MEVKLVITKGAAKKRTFHMNGHELVVGRLKGCGLRIPSGAVSRRHCRLFLDGDVVRIEDLGSANGILVNGKHVKGCAVKPGDTLTVGPITFEVQYTLTPAALDGLLKDVPEPKPPVKPTRPSKQKKKKKTDEAKPDVSAVMENVANLPEGQNLRDLLSRLEEDS